MKKESRENSMEHQTEYDRMITKSAVNITNARFGSRNDSQIKNYNTTQNKMSIEERKQIIDKLRQENRIKFQF